MKLSLVFVLNYLADKLKSGAKNIKSSHIIPLTLHSWNKNLRKFFLKREVLVDGKYSHVILKEDRRMLDTDEMYFLQRLLLIPLFKHDKILRLGSSYIKYSFCILFFKLIIILN